MSVYKKLENFWYHYKFHSIVALILAAIIAYAAYSMLTAEKYDYKAILYLSDTVSLEFDDALKDTMNEFGIDADGDGDISVQIKDLSYNPVSSELNYRQSQANTLAGELQNKDTFIFITDEFRFNELNERKAFKEQKGFDKKGGKAFLLNESDFGKALKKNAKKYGITEKIPNLYLSCRPTPPKGQMTEQATASLKAIENIVK
jgi:hypothetical protein